MTQQNHVVWTQARGGAISPATRQQFAYNATSAADDGSKTCPSGASSPSQSLLSLSPFSRPSGCFPKTQSDGQTLIGNESIW